MKAVIQRVKKASVTVSGEVVGKIDDGLLILLGVSKGDSEAEAGLLAEKISKLRIFSDGDDKMNLSVVDIGGKALVISNFTLCADVRRGTRPSFDPAMPPLEANRLYECFCESLENFGVLGVEKGIFGADMAVELLNDGPVTLTIDTDIWSKPRNRQYELM